MKKNILIAILISILITAGAYYYFFIMNAPEETQALPSKIKVAIKMPVTEPAAPEKAGKVPVKADKAPEVKKEETKKEIKKEQPKVQETKKEESKKTEPKKPEPQKPAMVVKEEPKNVKEPAKVEKKEEKQGEMVKPKPRVVGYRLEYNVKDEEEAARVRELLISNGYHTAKKVATGKGHKVIVSPFTDKWEAQYVRDSILKDTKINFLVKAVYK